MKEDNPDTNIKGDNSREITDCAGQGISFVIQLKLWLKPDIIKHKTTITTIFISNLVQIILRQKYL